MAATYTRTVNFTNSNPNGGEDYTWQNLNSNATWVTKSAGTNANEWNFTIQDNTAQNATTRSTTWKVTHWSYSTDDDPTSWDAFTITQYADGSTTVATTEFKNNPTTAATQATAATTEATQATAATTEATLGTAATTEATLGTAATTQPTNATAATTQPTSATAATTQPTSATAATTQATIGTAATTQPTPATTTQAKSISFTSGNKTVTSGGQSFLLSAQVNTDAVNGKNTSMPTITYKSSGGGGAGQMYWASDASGSTPISAPSWITNGSGGTFNSSGIVNMSVSINPYNVED